MYTAALKEEIKKLEQKRVTKNTQETLIEEGNASAKGEAKCVNKNCSFRGLDPHNKSAVGVCANCGQFEHFACVKIKAEHKEDISKGIMKYFCSSCFSKNPSNPALTTQDTLDPKSLTPRYRSRIGSIPIISQGYLDYKNTGEKNIKSTKNKCEVCEYVANSIQELRVHIENTHKSCCTTCDKVYCTVQELQAHVESEHNIACEYCDEKYRNRVLLDDHIKATHAYPCNFCDLTHNTPETLAKHKEEAHTRKCPFCESTFLGSTDLEDHIKGHHVHPCNKCTHIAKNSVSLEIHMTEAHNYPCSTCDSTFLSMEELDNHTVEKHCQEHEIQIHPTLFTCSLCEINFDNSLNLGNHMKTEHMHFCNICGESFNTRSQLNAHSQEKHSVQCNLCDVVTETQGELESHHASVHSIHCNICEQTLGTKAEMLTHQAEAHPTDCLICGGKFDCRDDLEKHIENNHTLTCDVCKFTANTEDLMENHILDKHARPDLSGQFECDDCEYKTKDKSDFGKHYKNMHGSNSSKNEANTVSKLKEDLRILQNNFERLEMMYRDALEEVNTVKAEYESKLIKANDSFASAKAENETLKEKVDVLFKLGRTYLNSQKATNNIEKQADKQDNTDIIEVEVHRSSAEDENLDLEGWTKNKMRGFKRNNPATQAVPSMNPLNSETGPISSRMSSSAQGPRSAGSMETRRLTNPSPINNPKTHENQGSGARTSSSENSENVRKTNNGGKQQIRYCHYFVNKGRCDFEERTGSQCKFEHKMAPMCNSGMNCSRHKCMFSHPKVNPASHHHPFLGRNMMMNPWPILNPWIQSPPSQLFQRTPTWSHQER